MAMKNGRKIREAEPLGMAFLDVMACGFGAVVLLLTLVKEDVFDLGLAKIQESSSHVKDAEEFLSYEVLEEEKNIAELQVRLSTIKNEVSRMRSETEVLQLAMSSAVKRNTAAPQKPNLYNAGIPVRDEHVLFIIDTSGSMKVQWDRVSETVESVIRSYPKVTGLQILDDNGNALIPGYENAWIPDTGSSRNRAIERLKEMQGFSNSSPAEGLEVALKNYNVASGEISIFVFGDDFTGASYDEVLAVIKRWNRRSNGVRKASINSVGFPWGLGQRYATLMREAGRVSGGVFVGLPN